jgi:hypothetical protein
MSREKCRFGADPGQGVVIEIERDGGTQTDKIINQLSGGKLSPEAKSWLRGVITAERDVALRGD